MSLIHSHNTTKKFYSFIHSLAQPFFGRAMEIGCRTQGKGTSIVLASYAFFPSLIRSKMDMEIFQCFFFFLSFPRFNSLEVVWLLSLSFVPQHIEMCVDCVAAHLSFLLFIDCIFVLSHNGNRAQSLRSICATAIGHHRHWRRLLFIYLFEICLKRFSWCVAPMSQN